MRSLCIFLFAIAVLGCTKQTATIPTEAKNPSRSRPPEYYANTGKVIIQSKLPFGELLKKVNPIRYGSTTAHVDLIVFFDPQCPHCARLITNTMSPTGANVLERTLWVPIGLVHEYSTLQSATLLSADRPDLAMMMHAHNVTTGKGKEFSLNVKNATQASIDKVVANTSLWRNAGADRVPFLVTRNSAGKTLSAYGVFADFELAEFTAQATPKY